MKKYILVLIFIFKSHFILANCQVEGGRDLNDPLFINLISQAECPQNVNQLKKLLKADGLKFHPSMVANRGRHNPKLGSFSLFEVVEGKSVLLNKEVKVGDFFFGHFTQLENGQVDLDQKPMRGKLLIELIVWDYKKGFYNFYELVGRDTGSSQWFYRGDSHDAYLDNQFLKRQPDERNPQFGNRMRCSACHNSGGPIMKELDYPHNDWWSQQRPLSFGQNQTSPQLAQIVPSMIDASMFSQAVKKGIAKLEKSAVKKGLSLPEILRPLFCTTEINLTSADVPHAATPSFFKIQSHFWVNPLLAQKNLNVNYQDYLRNIQMLGFHFPETTLPDADHPWLAPTQGAANILSIRTLVDSGFIDQEFAIDVLAVDFKNPLFSNARCQLLKYLPSSTDNWKNYFFNNLKNAQSLGAKELMSNLTDPNRNVQFHQQSSLKYLEEIQKNLLDTQLLKLEIQKLHLVRKSVFADEISKNPRGQILEPGFRVIFPKK